MSPDRDRKLDLVLLGYAILQLAEICIILAALAEGAWWVQAAGCALFALTRRQRARSVRRLGGDP